MTTRRADISLCSCHSSTDNISDFPALKEILPPGYKYNVCNWKSVDVDHFESRFRVNVTTKRQADLWLEEFSVSTNTHFKKEKDFPDCEEAIIYNLRCKHATKEPLHKCENIDFLVFKENICSTRLIIILKLPSFAEKYGSHDDVHLHDFPMAVIHHQHHNHLPELHVDTKKLSANNEHIVNCLEEVEIGLQNLATESSRVQNSNVGNVAEAFFCTESQSYQEVMECLFHDDNSGDETESYFLLPSENNPFNFKLDSDSLIDNYRATCKAKDRAAGIPAQSNKTWLNTKRYYQPVDMKVLPHNSLQDMINQALKKIEDLEETEKNSNNM